MATAKAIRAQSAVRPARLAFGLVVLLLSLWALGQHLSNAELAGAFRAAGDIGAMEWLGAVAATVLSFRAVGRYDAVAHRHLRTGIDDRLACRAGVCAIAFSQAVGFGLLTGAIARWRMLPGLPAATALRLTAFVAISFLSALVALAGFVTLFAGPCPGPGPDLCWLPALGLLVVPALAIPAFVSPVLRIGARRVALPSLPALGAIAVWTAVDTAAAALALTLLIPEAAGLGWGAVFPAYLLALCAALISGTPGGIGPFELTLVLLLPPGTGPDVIAGVVGFRLVYFALPAVVAGAVLLRRPPASTAGRQSVGRAAPLPFDRARAETAVVDQPEGRVLRRGGALVATVTTPQAVVGLFDPLAGSMPLVLDLLECEAHDGNRIACLYKCGARSAARARRAGWMVRRIAREAVVNTRGFDLAGSCHRQLRRKLRHAEKAGICIAAGAAEPGELAAVDAAWQAARGRARGTTMGRFTPSALAAQRLFVARQNGCVIAFATFHVCAREWCLDLIRWCPGATDGTMHALVVAAIRAAAGEGTARLSLAAVPDHPLSRGTGAGLAQFKASFAPQWLPLYLAAPGPAAMALCAADIARAVRWPSDAGAPPRPVHDDDEQNGFATPARP